MASTLVDSPTPENDRTTPKKPHDTMGGRILLELVGAQLSAMGVNPDKAERLIVVHTFRKWFLSNQGLPPGSTYFLRMNAPETAPPIKIGFSIKPATRVTEFSCGSPYPLTLLATFPAALLPERELHERFAGYRLRGEWFTSVLPLLELIKWLPRG